MAGRVAGSAGPALRRPLELHDDLGQSLLVLKMHLHALIRQFSPEAPIRQGLDAAVAYLLEIINKVRRTSWDLSPPTLENLGLSEALKNLFEEFQKILRS